LPESPDEGAPQRPSVKETSPQPSIQAVQNPPTSQDVRPDQASSKSREIQASSYAKRDAMRAVKLKHFVWKAGLDENRILFDLTIVNMNKIRVGEIEVVCSQYSQALDFLEAAKTVIAESIEPGQAKTFKAVPIGFANNQVKRINCVIADLEMRSGH
jgi:hypothetical protein